MIDNIIILLVFGVGVVVGIYISNQRDK
jgi:uncharacterized protein YneF (UPF0154 family)